MMSLPIALGLAGWGVGCSCKPTLPPPPPPETEDTAEETGATGDTGPPPPCPTPEEEPNDSVDTPNALPMEQRGCGTIAAPFDLDYWSFSLEEDGWLKVEVDASSGSIADMSFLLTPDDVEWVASRPDDPEALDATLIFPATAGVYSLTVSEQDFNGGEKYGYEVLVSEAKPPVESTTSELEPNDELLEANPVLDGDVVFGSMSGNGALEDFDWYAITIPAGKHTLSVDIDAFDVFSSADLTVYLYDAALNKLPAGCKDPCFSASCVPCALTGGITGLELDPIGSYDSSGAEIVYIQVSERFGREGPANWYVLSLGLAQ